MRNIMNLNKMEQKRIESEDKIKKLCDYVAQTQNEIFDEMVFEGSAEYENSVNPIADRLMMISVLANDALKSTLEFGLMHNKTYPKFPSMRNLDIHSRTREDSEQERDASNIDWVDQY